MNVITVQQLTRLYELYRDTELIFTKEIVAALNLDLRQVALKCLGSQWPCIVSSASLSSAKIIVGIKGGAFAAVTKENAVVALRFYFINSNDKQSVSFFVNSHVKSIKRHEKNKDLAVITLAYTQRPPDDLIEIMGKVIETVENTVRYKDAFIALNEDVKRRIGVLHEDTKIFIDNIPRHCIIRDLGFTKAKIMLLGLAPFLRGKKISLRIEFGNPEVIVNLEGVITATEEVSGRKDIITAIVDFDVTSIPMVYKKQLSNYITSQFNKRTLANMNSNTSQGAPQENMESKSF